MRQETEPRWKMAVCGKRGCRVRTRGAKRTAKSPAPTPDIRIPAPRNPARRATANNHDAAETTIDGRAISRHEGSPAASSKPFWNRLAARARPTSVVEMRRVTPNKIDHCGLSAVVEKAVHALPAAREVESFAFLFAPPDLLPTTTTLDRLCEHH